MGWGCLEEKTPFLQPNIVELQCLEHLWNYEYMFDTGVVRADEC